MSRFPYQLFSNFVYRTPLFSSKEFQKIFSNKKVNVEIFENIFSDKIFQEALYLASPDLYTEVENWINGKYLNSSEKQNNLQNTVLKYYTRMSTRCTPFGLFSGIGLGNFENKVATPLHNLNNFNLEKIRNTTPDMHFLVALSQYLLSISYIKNRILFFPNNSIYKIGKKIRYIEYENNNGKRDYIISSVPLAKELEEIINYSEKGKTIEQLISILVKEDISYEESFEYIEELIQNQILISELEPNVAGEDFLNSIISILHRIEADEQKDVLVSIQNRIKILDNQFGNSVHIYSEIEEFIQSLAVSYEKKYLFQTDVYFNNKVTLPYCWKKDLKNAISFLNKITLKNNNSHIEKFKRAFYERFENEEVPLSYALDTEIGVGYRQDIQTKGIHPYLEDLLFPKSNEKQILEIKLDAVQIILNQKLQEANLKGSNIIQLSDSDFKNFEENWEDLPETMSFMVEMISENKYEKLYLNNGSGNAGRLLARFCSEKSDIKELVKEISKKEDELSSNEILAEIIHLPESRIGNILRRPTLRSYEIPYLAKSSLPTENQITVDDLYISIKNNKIVLRSKKYNKKVRPYLTNAHNYSANSLPVYHFLCDLETQDDRFGLYFQWGGLSQIYNFLPRVEYKNIIFSKAQWKINSEEINWLSSILNKKEKIQSEVENWRQLRRIPKWIQWVKGDNTLVINLENEDLFMMFISSIKKEEIVIIDEFLSHEENNFNSQFIFPMYKTYNP